MGLPGRCHLSGEQQQGGLYLESQTNNGKKEICQILVARDATFAFRVLLLHTPLVRFPSQMSTHQTLIILSCFIIFIICKLL